MKNPWVVIGVIAVVLFGGAIWYSNVAAERNNEGIEIKQNIKGNTESKVKLVEYSDFQCPACASFQPILNGLMEEYGDRISLEYKHFPLPIHPFSLPAAVAAEAAGQQGKFFEYHDMLFSGQQAWSNSPTPNTFFLQYAQDLELDVDTFKRQMTATALRDKVKSEMEEGRQLDITGTPTFFLNGRKMEFDTFQSFMEQIVVAIDPSLRTSSSTDDSIVGEQTGNTVKFGI